jgi:predicted nuclease of predicted toxin-antitoxin system
MSFPPLKFLIDVGVGRAVEQFLEQQGYEVKTVRSLDSRMPDIDIIRLAVQEERLIMTMDKDFGELVYHLRMPHCGVLLLRLENATGAEKVQIVANLLANYSSQLANHFAVFQNNRLRIRKILH